LVNGSAPESPEPLGRGLIGAGEEDEIEINLGTRIRVGMIEKIERGRAAQLRA
jgi:hypothetical protein